MPSALVVDMGALTDERNRPPTATDGLVRAQAQDAPNLRPLMPPAETLPDERIVLLGEESYSGRDICARGEDLRRRLGWHGKDRLMLCQGEKPSGHGLVRRLAELTAAFAQVSGTVLAPPHGEGLMELSRLEKATILSMDASAFIELSDGLEPGLDAGELRMALAEEELSPQAVQNWKRVLPHVPVNGQGHEGGFRYDCEWF